MFQFQSRLCDNSRMLFRAILDESSSVMPPSAANTLFSDSEVKMAESREVSLVVREISLVPFNLVFR